MAQNRIWLVEYSANKKHWLAIQGLFFRKKKYGVEYLENPKNMPFRGADDGFYRIREYVPADNK